MPKDSRILQKRLSGIESLLKEVVSLPVDDDGGGDGDRDMHNKCKRYCEEIEQRLEFVGKILSAEIASGKPPHHLRHIGKRLLELREDFYEWKKGKEVMQKDNVGMESTSTDWTSEAAVEVADIGVDREEEMVKEEEERELLPVGRFIRVFASGVVAGMGLMAFCCLRGSFDFVNQSVVSFTPT